MSQDFELYKISDYLDEVRKKVSGILPVESVEFGVTTVRRVYYMTTTVCFEDNHFSQKSAAYRAMGVFATFSKEDQQTAVAALRGLAKARKQKLDAIQNT